MSQSSKFTFRTAQDRVGLQTTLCPSEKAIGKTPLRYVSDSVAKYLILASGTISFLVLVAIIGFTVRESIPAFTQVGFEKLFLGLEWRPINGEFGLLPMIIGSIVVTLAAMTLAIPLGIATAVLIAEVAPPQARRVLNTMVQLMAGIPSVVYGLVGMVLVVPVIRQIGGSGFSVAAGAIVLMAMVLPTIITITADSIKTLPPGYKQGALGMGATHWQTIWHVLLPAARPGIGVSIILGMGRAIGETMAMIMVIGNSPIIPDSLLSSARTLTGNIAVEIAYASGLHQSVLFATGVVLFVLVIGLNSAAIWVLRRGDKMLIGK